MYSITKEQLQDIYNDGCTYIKEWFPEVFETKLEVGKWHKTLYGFCINIIDETHWTGLDRNKDWRDNVWYHNLLKDKDFIEATEQEVKTALENEAIKRGYKQNTHIESINKKYGISMLSCKQSKFKNNTLTIGGCCVFNNGIWATIIPTLTKKEAEEKLGVKII